jgi:hypothetical protein
MLLFVAQLERGFKVIRLRPKDDRGSNAIIGVNPKLPGQSVSTGPIGFIEAQVTVRIDDSRHDRLARHIDPCGTGGDLDCGACPDSIDAAVCDDDRGLLERSAPGTIDDACASQRDGAAGGCLRVRRLKRKYRESQQSRD